jgi:hypothetical protein
VIPLFHLVEVIQKVEAVVLRHKVIEDDIRNDLEGYQHDAPNQVEDEIDFGDTVRARPVGLVIEDPHRRDDEGLLVQCYHVIREIGEVGDDLPFIVVLLLMLARRLLRLEHVLVERLRLLLALLLGVHRLEPFLKLILLVLVEGGIHVRRCDLLHELLLRRYRLVVRSEVLLVLVREQDIAIGDLTIT